MRRGIRAHVANNVNSQNAASQRSQHPASQQSQLPDTQPGLVEVDGNSQPAVVVWGRLCSRRTEIKSLDLTKPEFKAGRDASCDYIFDGKQFAKPSDMNRVSKIHFSIEYDDEVGKSHPAYIIDHSGNGTYVNEQKIGKGNRRILMNNDIIAVGAPRFKAFQFQDMRALDSKNFPPEVNAKYFISRLLGKGACGVVRLVYEISTCRKYAIKEVSKAKVAIDNLRREVELKKLLNEVRIMQSLQHPCVIQMHDAIETNSSIYMILEFMEGGELLNRIVDSKQKYLEENICKLLFYQLCHGVKYLHDSNITHRDLKPDNILLQSRDEETLLKISDFGLSKAILNDTSALKTICGTPLYVAPEILENRAKRSGTYSKKVDIWSMGVVLFAMLSGSLPFSDDYGSTAASQILSGKYHFRHKRWEKVSATAVSLIKSLLIVNPAVRPSIEQILDSPWLQDRDMQIRAHKIMGVPDIDDTLQMSQVSDDSDVENTQVTLIAMNISDENAEILSPPLKRRRYK